MADNKYCTLADVTGLADEYTVPTGYSDADVNVIILEMSQWIDAVTGSHWGSTAATFIVDGRGSELLRLDQKTSWPIVSITQIQRRDSYANADDFDSNGEVLDSDNYRVSDSRRAVQTIEGTTARGAIAAPGTWVRGTGNYKITGVFGQSEVPKGIVFACTLLVRERMSPGASRKFEDMQSERWPDGYSYARRQLIQSEVEVMTGYPAVDRLLVPFRMNDFGFVPLM